MIRFILANLRQRHALRQSISGLLRRADDHLLEDIGLTRAEVQALIAAPLQPQPRFDVYAPLHA
ncbi:hypothetical protein GCM10010873_06210 [Cypionkella aquatica]|uniref:DUF1127 domain-containing protein n=1 Tax=Cypionkella aquatica TaxID=1756042 RepID=A0AA37TR08_9RHOB|nr:hypothetical protein [Cypionkella aquatica]GLS85648.1 hypothetical protein GCM10010873_06210 [Cypionkella aquatica]